MATYAVGGIHGNLAALDDLLAAAPRAVRVRSDMKTRFTEAQIIGVLQEAEAGMPVTPQCQRGARHAVSDRQGANAARVASMPQEGL